MSERPTSASVVVHLLIAATVLGLGFGGGVFWGWRTRRLTPKTPNTSAESMTDAEVKSELADCKRELKDAKKARAKEQVTAILKEMDDAGLESIAKVEALQKEVHECHVRETLENGYVCGTIGKHINFYDVLAYSMSCVDTPWIGEYLVHSLDKCAEFEDFPAHLEDDKLSKGESERIYESLRNHDYESKNNLVAGMKHIRRECRRIWALPPE
jgi:hypothetical protein